MDEQKQSGLVNQFTFGKKGASYQVSHALAQGVVPAFEMVGFVSFIAAIILLWWQNQNVSHDLTCARHDTNQTQTLLYRLRTNDYIVSNSNSSFSCDA